MKKGAGGGGQNGQMSEMQREIAELRRMLGNVAQATAIENVVQQGLEKISSHLEPLRDMSQRREFPSTESMEKFVAIQQAIAQPRWRGSNFDADLPDDNNCDPTHRDHEHRKGKRSR